MEEFDVVIVGAGSGITAAYYADLDGKSVAIIDHGAAGGTCVNRGCIPTKGLIQSAEVMRTIQNADKFGISVDPSAIRVDFKKIMDQVRGRRERGSGSVEGYLESTFTFVRGTAVFVSEKVLKVGEREIRGEKIFICTGNRPTIPPIPGLETVDYLTNSSVLELDQQPEELLVLGGGYIGTEFSHFFSSLGTKVTVVESHHCLLREDREVSDLFTEVFSNRVTLHAGFRATEVEKKDGKIQLTIKHEDHGREQIVLTGDQLLIATGRMPNTERLELEKTGVELNEHGFVKVDEYLRTTHPDIYAYGDVIGQSMFKHTSSYEGELAYNNSQGGAEKVSYRTNPHAVFSDPQIGAVGLTEEEAKELGLDYRVGKKNYTSVMKGRIIGSPNGFAKVLVENGTNKILGFHMIGPDAGNLIHEVVVAMNAGEGTIDNITKSIHVHPTMPELIRDTFLAAE